MLESPPQRPPPPRRPSAEPQHPAPTFPKTVSCDQPACHRRDMMERPAPSTTPPRRPVGQTSPPRPEFFTQPSLPCGLLALNWRFANRDVEVGALATADDGDRYLITWLVQDQTREQLVGVVDVEAVDVDDHVVDLH